MKTIGDYYSVIRQAEKTYDDLDKLMMNYPVPKTGQTSFEYTTLQQARAYVRAYIDKLKKVQVEE